MAYVIHITKRKSWFDKNLDITLEEWKRLLEVEPELIPSEKVEGETKDGAKVAYALKGSFLAKWNNPTTHNVVWFNYHDGIIDISDPDESTIKKAKDIASKLKAKVQGDELESY